MAYLIIIYSPDYVLAKLNGMALGLGSRASLPLKIPE